MSNELKQFLAAWLAWAEAGGPDDSQHTKANPYRFARDAGLCSNTYDFEELALDVHPDNTGNLEHQLHVLFRKDGRDASYPFGRADYEEDADCNTQHLNPRRRSWVCKMLEAA